MEGENLDSVCLNRNLCGFVLEIVSRRGSFVFVMASLVELASRIKAARKKQGLTLEQISARSGLGKGLLSKVENYRVTPSLPSLIKISKALGVRLESLFEGLDEEIPVPVVVRRGEGREMVRHPENVGFRYFDLSSQSASHRMTPFELEIPAGEGREEILPHEGEEFVTVLEGQVVLRINDEEYLLGVGDSAFFDAEVPHCVTNPAITPARLICVLLPRQG